MSCMNMSNKLNGHIRFERPKSWKSILLRPILSLARFVYVPLKLRSPLWRSILSTHRRLSLFLVKYQGRKRESLLPHRNHMSYANATLPLQRIWTVFNLRYSLSSSSLYLCLHSPLSSSYNFTNILYSKTVQLIVKNQIKVGEYLPFKIFKIIFITTLIHFFLEAENIIKTK